MRFKTAMILACATAMISTTANAQALADKVPANAVYYFGWAGADAAKTKLDGTHLKALLNESRVHEIFGTYLDQLETQIVKREPKAAEPFRLIRKLGAPVWKYPTAIYVSKPDLTKRQPVANIVLISQAGAEADALATEIQGLIPKGRNAQHITVGASDGLVTLTLGNDATGVDTAGGTLATATGFAGSIKQVKVDPLVTVYVDFTTLVGVIEEGVGANEAQAAPKVKAFLDTSGLRGVKQLICASGFEGANWTSECFLATDSTRTGLLKALPAGPTDASLLKGVPASATLVKTIRFDPAVFTSELRASLKATDEEAHKFYNMGFGALQQALGVNVEQSILAPLGTDWVVYSAPEVGSGGMMGLVAVNKIDDPAALKKGLTTASFNLVNWANVAMSHADRDANLTIRGSRIKIGEVDVNYLATPFVAPAWAIDDGKLYLGFYPQTVGAAVRQARAGKASIAENPKYVAAMKSLGQANLDTVGYYDLPTSSRHGSMYTTLLLLGRYAGIADLFGPTLPEPILPPNDIILEHLEPSVDGSWTDANGIHWRSVHSFPGAMLLSEQTAFMSAGVGSAAIGTSILLPSLNRARETANRVKSASNLKQIGVGILLYSNENKNQYPPSLAELVKTQDLPFPIFDNPRGGNDLSQPPQDVFNDADRLAQFVVENSDYIYVGAGLTNSANAETIVAYENPDFVDDGINILFADGHVEFLAMDDALQMIEADKAKRGGL